MKIYSSVLRTNGKQLDGNTSKILVIIKPKKSGINSKQTTNEVKKIAKKYKLNTGVKSIKDISNGGLIIDCNNKEESELVNDIISKNKVIGDYLKGKSEAQLSSEFKFRFHLRRNSSNQNKTYVFELSPQLKQIINKMQTINIGWQACAWNDFIHIIRCFKCNKFGHKSADCKESHDSCGLCSESHKTKDCKKQESEHCCINCKQFNSIKQQAILATNHSSFDKSCESFKRIKNIIISKIDYD